MSRPADFAFFFENRLEKDEILLSNYFDRFRAERCKTTVLNWQTLLYSYQLYCTNYSMFLSTALHYRTLSFSAKPTCRLPDPHQLILTTLQGSATSTKLLNWEIPSAFSRCRPTPYELRLLCSSRPLPSPCFLDSALCAVVQLTASVRQTPSSFKLQPPASVPTLR